jgi:hypothetical protein
VPELDQPSIAKYRNDDLEVSVRSTPKITLNDGARESCAVCNNPLFTFPELTGRAPSMPKVAAFENNSLEILVRGTDIAL